MSDFHPVSYQGRSGHMATTFSLQRHHHQNACQHGGMATSHHHANFGHLTLLVFEAVLEVVCVSLPGYVVARQGMFDADSQVFLANLNVMLFTPCLIFTKLASQLTADKLIELAIIPAIFIIQTLVSFLSAFVLCKIFRFRKRPANFVTAMSVFGNSNSLPISLVLSLSKTLPGLRWDKIPGDNEDEIAARGILYLVVFQQLGQMLRWSWGYHVLLKAPDKYTIEEGGCAVATLENGSRSSIDSQTRLLADDGYGDSVSSDDGPCGSFTPTIEAPNTPDGDSHGSTFNSGAITPMNGCPYASSSATLNDDFHKAAQNQAVIKPQLTDTATLFHRNISHDSPSTTDPSSAPTLSARFRNFLSTTRARISRKLSRHVHTSLPFPIQSTLSAIFRVLASLWRGMNPPLWAMLFAVLVASVPSFQRTFFTPGTFINNSVTRAVQPTGGVAVPLILVVLGANLARNTTPPSQHPNSDDDPKLERNLLIACLLGRMVIPTLVMAPILAVIAKWVPVSILDDPIFVVVAFLLTGAPSALQLAQICQVNGVYVEAMTRLLFSSYVVWILPSTLILVMAALQVVKWAAA